MIELLSNTRESINTVLNEESPAVFGRALKGGQLKERSEGVQAQWQTALGVVMAAGS
jgi:hypothetical protein